MGADGQPQSSLVWVDYDGVRARTDTTLERQKGRNMQANPKVSLLVVDPDNTGRFMQIRGDAELVTEGAPEQLDALTRKYTRHPRYYGYIYPESSRLARRGSSCGSTRGGSRSMRSIRENDGPSLLRTRRRRVGASDPIGAYDPTRPQLSRLTTPRDGPSGTRGVP